MKVEYHVIECYSVKEIKETIKKHKIEEARNYSSRRTIFKRLRLVSLR